MNRHDEVQSRQDRGKAGDEDAERGQDDVAIGVGAAVRRVKRPAGIDSADDDDRERQEPADSEDVPAREVELGKG